MFVLGNRLLIREEDPAAVKKAVASKIIIPDEAAAKMQQRGQVFWATVVAIGDGDKINAKLKSGPSRVLCARMGGMDMPDMPGVKMVSSEDVLVVIK